MSRPSAELELGRLRKADEIHAGVVELSRRRFQHDSIGDMEGFVREAELLMRGVSVNTVSNHRNNMVQRLGARDSTALVQLAKMASLI